MCLREIKTRRNGIPALILQPHFICLTKSRATHLYVRLPGTKELGLLLKAVSTSLTTQKHSHEIISDRQYDIKYTHTHTILT